MSVYSITAGIGLAQADLNKTIKPLEQDFSQIMGALQSGDVSGAEQVYVAMQQLLPGTQASTQATANSVKRALSENAATHATSAGSSNTVTASGSTSASLMSIYNTDGSLKTRQKWNADRALVIPSATEQAQLDAAHAIFLRPYISQYAYLTSVQDGMLMNDVDTAGKPITGPKSVGPSTITQHQADLYAQAKQQGANPASPTDLLDMLGIA